MIRDLDYLGEALRLLREASGQMQKDVAKETRMSRSQVSRYERGHDTPNLVTLVRYLDVVGADFADLQVAVSATKETKGKAQEGEEDSRRLRTLLKPMVREVVLEMIVEFLSEKVEGKDRDNADGDTADGDNGE